MKGLNKVSLIGNLGKDPEMKLLANSIVVTKFSLATTETFKDESGKKHVVTDWHSIIVWRNIAEFAGKYLQKGNLVYVEGKLKTRTFEDKSGQKRYVTEIIADDLILLDNKSKQSYKSDK